MSRRMFSTEIVNSDPFLDMPPSTQALYFHLGLHTDDDGFVYPKKVMRLTGSGDDDLKILLTKKFLLPFESGVMVVKHWKVNNYIRPDRKHESTHREEIAQLTTDSGGVYRMSTNCLPDGSISREVGREVGREVSKKEAIASQSSEQLREQIGEIAKVKRVV